MNRNRSKPARRKEIESLEDSRRTFMAAMQRGDARALAAHYSPDAILVPQTGAIRRGKTSIDRFLRLWLSTTTIRKFEVETDDLRVVGDMACAVGTYRMATSDAGSASAQDEGKFLIVYERGPGGKWRIVRDMSSSSKP